MAGPGTRTVTAPAPTPLPFGLLAAAVVVDDPDRLDGGVDYEALACGTVQLTEAGCFTEAAAAPYVASDGVPRVYADGFRVYALHTCRAVGGQYDDAARIVRAKLAAGEGRAIEEGYANRVLRAAATAEDPYPDLTPTPGTAVALPDALAVAEEYAGAVYSSVPVFHAARSLATMLTSKAGVQANGARLETKLGSPVAAGAGYVAASRAAIGGVTPDPGERWLFVTGAVMVRRGGVSVSDPVLAKTNTFGIFANRPVTASSECFRARILVQSPAAAAGV